jgi:hypothetical protein
MGFGFRGSSPPWPYVGQGRGGLPRCAYFLGRAGTNAPETAIITSQMPKEQELDLLKSQVSTIQSQLELIETRMRELEAS